MAAKKKKAKAAGGIAVNCAFDAMIDIGKLKPNPRNPNRHPAMQIEALARLIERLGWRAPVTVSNRSGLVVRGHGRIEAAKRIGAKVVPVDWKDYASEADEWTDLLADNRLPELAEMDDRLTAEILVELKNIDADISLAGYSERDFEKIVENTGDRLNEEPEVAFTEELHESSNYIVLKFDNDIDWLQALTLFGLKTVKALDSKPGFEKAGIGRVIDGVDAINRLTE